MTTGTDQAHEYARVEIARFTSRVRLTEVERELLEAMFALAWHHGYCTGVNTLAAKLSEKPENER